VYDYEGGKMDWLGHALPFEGDADLVAHHIDKVRACSFDTPIADAAEQARHDGLCVLIDNDIVAGVIDARSLPPAGEFVTDAVVTWGPATVRPSEERASLDERLTANDLAHILVTDPGGRLLGVFRR
jgi:hypothetical protein